MYEIIAIILLVWVLTDNSPNDGFVEGEFEYLDYYS